MVKRILKSYDYSLIVVYAVLSIFGLVMVYSASMVAPAQRWGVPSDYFFLKHMQNLALAYGAFLLFALLPYKMYKSNKILMTIVFGSVIVLGLLTVLGTAFGGAQSWFDIGIRSIQPSELVKLVVIVYLAAIYAKKQAYINELNRGVVPPLIYLVIITFLIALQPDLGTASIVFAVGISLLICSGTSMKTLVKLVSILMILAALLSPVFLLKPDLIKDYQSERIAGYLNPFEEEDGGRQVRNAYIAIGLGGITGVGLGKGIQKNGYIPEAHTDFIMAVIAEELGLIGVLFTLSAIGYLVFRGIILSIRCKDAFGKLLAIGISSLIAIQTVINLGGLTGLIPVTGVPLPFISYGGSALLVLSIGLGILVNISMFTNYSQNYNEKKDEPLPKEGSTRTSKFKVYSAN
ncbi:FtsW/RodA/SpoVE family cell cycle protein [Bacillus fonticola]|uniref:FtsW/RodA/SpoVE family cell cycle protein n=1 Tax=Bacillus fonticola TaxID=2728853 RepID=UPI001472CC5D|nr:FtsW/RodA/SpoVE family cell cycle protein [Bacillus fonticola]